MKRIFGLDLIRVFAVFFVICTHFFLNTSFYKVPFEGEQMIIQALLRWIFIICVPLFLMLTGFLQSKKELSINYYENITPILGVYILYSVLAIVVRTLYFNEEEPTLVWLADIMAFRANGYAWYINMYIGLYLLIPFLNIIFNSMKTQKEHKRLLLTMIFLTAVPGFFNNIPGNMNIFHFPDWWMTIYPLTYYYLGAYIRHYKVKLPRTAAVLLFLLVTICETFISVHFSSGRNFYNAVGDYGSILILIQTVLFFLIFYDVEVSSKGVRKVFETVSILSLDIYLCSYISDRVIYDYVMKNVFKSQQQILSFFIIITVCSFIMSLSVPLLRHIINSSRLYLSSRLNRKLQQ